MYDKSGVVLRVETVINNPEEFRVRKQVLRKGKPQTEWVTMRSRFPSANGRQVMGTSLYLRNHHFPNAYSKIAA